MISAFVNNKEIDVVLIKNFPDEDCVVAEISYRNTKFYGIILRFVRPCIIV